ncbi:MAG: hypothetical protein DWQ31_19980 [Planctomycetota bacterium]|nr:MAG: hypothetical protein DWQ31_19980 [Planctomycetota bacterium]REJ94040.1 MAG: hypothetical protein DWQ35_09170 [Planctomycetota bacterium]REK17861.1 MAG: hypothetical protein DWQ42_21345 [Planctomycetota bacterium]REK42402.1 MAG: hypothetical protein DWQ46_13495 [Planctomycetota bacterium]
MSADDFARIDDELTSSGIAGAIAVLCEQLKAEGKYHELFDARLMQCRQRAGAPLAREARLEELSDATRDEVEAGYVEACREVGNLLLAAGDLRAAWMYLRPAGDEATMREALAAAEPDESNLDQIVELSLHEGLDVDRGFSIVLDHYGICNAITTYDSAMYTRSIPEKQVAVGQLVRRLHAELLENLGIESPADSGAGGASGLLEFLEQKRDAFGEHTYHVDISHLSSVVRMSRIVEDTAALRLAWELTEYGRALHESLQPPGDPPFEDAFAVSGLFFAAQLGEQVDKALEYFRQRAEQANVYEEGSAVVEVYVALLARLGRFEEAIAMTLDKLPHGTPTTGFAPSLLELSRRGGDYERLLAECRQRGDLLGYAIGRIEAESAAE